MTDELVILAEQYSNIRLLPGALKLFIEFSGESPGMGLEYHGSTGTRRGNFSWNSQATRRPWTSNIMLLPGLAAEISHRILR